jgi:hypothetical protein
MENKEKKFDIKRLWTTKVFGIPVIFMILIWGVFTAMPLVLYCPADDFMCMSDAGSVIKDLFSNLF